MKTIFPILFVLFAASAISCKKSDTVTDNTIPAAPDTGKYITTQFDASQITYIRNVAYSTRPNTNGNQYSSDSTRGTDTLSATITLRLDVLVPPNASASKKQPMIVYIHGGNFSAGNKEDMEEEALTYARAGYVVSSINYRLTPDNEVNSTVRIKSIIDAMDDASNAIRFLKLNANTYFIDTARIATIGSSAGGGISLINAVQYDGLLGTVSDYPAYSSKVAGAISTGATLVESGINPLDFLVFNSYDTPVLLFHANPEDGYRHTTWTGNVLPTQQLFHDAGAECDIVAQPDMTHTVNLSLGGPYWSSNLKDFIWKKLKIYDIK
jgi:poly(3-hydroxybutyrate) depolymerase